MSFNVQFDRQKFKSVVHQICARTDARELGKVKLHKILYFADMLTFTSTGRPLTGVEYQKQQFGPTARHLSWALKELQSEGAIRIVRRDYFGFEKFDFESLRSAPQDLTDNERQLLDDVIEFVCGRSAREISDLSHSAAWESAKMGEVIPYFTAFLLFPCEVTDDDLAWGEEEARRLFTSDA